MNDCTITPTAASAPSRAFRNGSATARHGLLERFVRAWRAYRKEHAERRLDAWFIRERTQHEQYLRQAQDVYELERLERAYERRETFGTRK